MKKENNQMDKNDFQVILHMGEWWCGTSSSLKDKIESKYGTNDRLNLNNPNNFTYYCSVVFKILDEHWICIKNRFNFRSDEYWMEEALEQIPDIIEQYKWNKIK